MALCGQVMASVRHPMSITKPYRRTCRQFADGSYSEGGRWMYLLHPKYAKDPRHYVRAFLLIQQDVLELFSYVEPSDANLSTYSHRIQQLLMRSCVEIEANFTAIFLDNEYSRAMSGQNLNTGDYKLINLSHRLSAYQVRIPGWKGAAGIRRPFAPWLSNLRRVPFIGQFWPLTSLTPGGRNSVRYQYRPHGEFCLPGSCGALHGSTSIGSGRG